MPGLKISIVAGSTAKESTVTATGSLVNIIADSERASFGILSDADLKRAIGKYFGKEPDRAFLKSPTPPDVDLYKHYGWPEVQRMLRPTRAQILEVNAKPTIISFNTLSNESNRTATYTTKISEQVTDTVSNEWSNSNKISAEQMIKYEVGFKGIGVGSETRFGIEQTWGKSATVSKQMNVGMETGVTFDLKPKESAIVELCASRGTMRAQVTYGAYLTGYAIAIYHHKYKNHHHWGINIGAILGDSNKVQVVEDVEVGYYSNATAKLKNLKSNEEMMLFEADHPSESSSTDDPYEPPSSNYQDEPPSEES